MGAFKVRRDGARSRKLPNTRDAVTWAGATRANLLQLKPHGPVDAVVLETAQDVLLRALQLVDILQMEIITKTSRNIFLGNRENHVVPEIHIQRKQNE